MVHGWPTGWGGLQTPPSVLFEQLSPVRHTVAGREPLELLHGWPGPEKAVHVPQPPDALQYRPASAWQLPLTIGSVVLVLATIALNVKRGRSFS